MGFSTNTFLFIFLVITLGLYIPVRLLFPKFGTFILLAASLVFYSWMDVTALPVLGVFILVNYMAGLVIGSLRRKRKTAAGIFLALIIIFNVYL